MSNFDYHFYINKYEDLIHFNEKDAYAHYNTFGLYEGRLCNKDDTNEPLNITIIIHLFFTDLFDEMMQYIENVKRVFANVNIMFTIRENSLFSEQIKQIYPNAFIILVENKGVDVYPFLECIKYIRHHNIPTNFILKIHTKVSSNDIEGNSDWRKDLIKPITDYNNLLILRYYFKKVKNIGYIGAQKCILPKNYDNDFYHNIRGINELCETFSHLEKNWTDFNGGNMFWINNEVLDKYLTNKLIEYLIERCVPIKPPCNATDKGIYVEYLCERLFTGVFCYDRTNILLNDFNGTRSGTNLGESYFHQPKVFSFHTPKNIFFDK